MKADLTPAQVAALGSILERLRKTNPGREGCFRLSSTGSSVGYTPPGSDRTYVLYSTHIAGPEVVDCRGEYGYPTFAAAEF